MLLSLKLIYPYYSLLLTIGQLRRYTRRVENIIQMAITMTEMDTGTTLSSIERQEMAKRIKAKVEDINQD